MRFIPITIRAALVAGGAFLLSACGGPQDTRLAHRSLFTPAQSDAGAAYRPSPSLGPADVVRIQLEALRTNDELRGDAGIALVFQFASPANRTITGPLDRFVELVKTPEYRPMLNHRRAEAGPLIASGDLAEQRVVITSAGGDRVTYVFVLARQRNGAYAGCWMTEGGLRELPEDREPPWNVRRV